MKKFNKNINRVIAILLEIAVGILLMIDPAGFTSGIIVITGIVLMVAGVVNIVRYFTSDRLEAAAGQLLTRGLILAVGGAFCAFNAGWFMLVFPMLTVLYGAALVVTGVMKIQLTADMIRAGSRRWFLPGINAALSIVCGLVVLFNPFATSEFIGMFAGIALIVTAVFDLITMIASRDKNRHDDDEIIQ